MEYNFQLMLTVILMSMNRAASEWSSRTHISPTNPTHRNCKVRGVEKHLSLDDHLGRVIRRFSD